MSLSSTLAYLESVLEYKKTHCPECTSCPLDKHTRAGYSCYVCNTSLCINHARLFCDAWYCSKCRPKDPMAASCERCKEFLWYGSYFVVDSKHYCRECVEIIKKK